MKLQTSSITRGTYALYVETENFAERRSLTYITKQYSFLLQLSKAIFLPGDLVQFRVYAVDSETRAVDPKCTNIVSITDQNENEITTFRNVSFKRGKYENSFQLSNKAGLGGWTLHFQCDEQVRNFNIYLKNTSMTTSIHRSFLKILRLLNIHFH